MRCSARSDENAYRERPPSTATARPGRDRLVHGCACTGPEMPVWQCPAASNCPAHGWCRSRWARLPLSLRVFRESHLLGPPGGLTMDLVKEGVASRAARQWFNPRQDLDCSTDPYKKPRLFYSLTS